MDKPFSKKVDYGNDTIPDQLFVQHMGGHNRTGLLDCNPHFDHGGRRWEDIGVTYPDFRSQLNLSLNCTIANTLCQTDEADHNTSRSDYNWNPFLAVLPRDAIVNRTVGTPLGPTGWLTRAGQVVDIAGHNKLLYVSQACQTVCKYTRHTAGTIPYLAVSPHGWVRWSGVVAQLKDVTKGHNTKNRY